MVGMNLMKQQKNQNKFQQFIVKTMSTSLSKSGTVQSQGELLKKVQLVYEQIANRINQKVNYTVSLSLFHEYHQRISYLIRSLPIQSNNILETDEQEGENSEQVEDNDFQPYEVCRQSPYMYLRRAWQRKESSSISNTIIYDPQDHIDKLSKTVAMIRQQTVYMAKKQNYLYQKDQSNHSLLNQNPLFIKIKQQLQTSQLQKQQLQKKCNQQALMVQRLNKDKLLLEKSLKSLKKKFQEIEKSWIEVSKKSISLQQELLLLKSQSSKSRISAMKEGYGQLTNSSSVDVIIRQPDTIKPTKLMQRKQQPVLSLSQKDAINSNKSTETSPDTLRPLQNFFMDIKYNKSDYQLQKNNNSYFKENSLNETSCELTKIENQKAGGDSGNGDVVDNNMNTNNNENNKKDNYNINGHYNNNITKNHQLASSKEITEAIEQKQYKNPIHQPSTRSILLSSTRSVDVISKISSTKPKFERTKPNIKQTLLKSFTKDDSISANIQKVVIIKNQSYLNDQSTALIKRSFISKRKQAK